MNQFRSERTLLNTMFELMQLILSTNPPLTCLSPVTHVIVLVTWLVKHKLSTFNWWRLLLVPSISSLMQPNSIHWHWWTMHCQIQRIAACLWSHSNGISHVSTMLCQGRTITLTRHKFVGRKYIMAHFATIFHLDHDVVVPCQTTRSHLVTSRRQVLLLV